MNANAQRELENIKIELDGVIREIESIASSIRTEYSGIGNDLCADSLTKVAQWYRKAKKQLNDIDTSKVRQEFLDEHGSSGGGSSGGGSGGGGGSSF